MTIGGFPSFVEDMKVRFVRFIEILINHLYAHICLPWLSPSLVSVTKKVEKKKIRKNTKELCFELYFCLFSHWLTKSTVTKEFSSIYPGIWKRKVKWSLWHECVCHWQHIFCCSVLAADITDSRINSLLPSRTSERSWALLILCFRAICLHDVSWEPDDDCGKRCA